MSPERFFYHSFPRRGTDNNAKGISIIRSLVKLGFVLTPEQVEWKERLRGGGFAKPDFVKQIRICFTELSPSELPEHSTRFGKFAFEFDIATLRKLGALPVIYLPTDTGQASGHESAASASIARMSQLTRVLDRLLMLKAFIRNNPHATNLEIENGEATKVKVPAKAAADILATLEQDVQPLEQLQASLRFLTSYFYPTENLHYNDLLDYYRQREWRLGAGMVTRNLATTRQLNDSEKMSLVAIDREFFEGVLEFRKVKHKRIDLCQMMPEFESESIISLVRRLIVPRCALESAHAVLRTVPRAPEIVALEDL